MLGSGGMGEVYRARDTRLRREVALKVLPDELSLDPEQRRRVEQEARATSALSSPGIVSIYDVGSANGVTYLVFELIEGSTLREVLSQGAVPLRRALDWAAQIADALAATHRVGIIHQDLKPENIMIARDGRVRVLDFGIARVSVAAVGANSATETMLEERRRLAGTPAYMSPEQIRGDRTDERSDIFSLGLILYEMLSRRAAFMRPSTVETLAAVLTSDPPELPAEVPTLVRSAVERCVEKEPERRFQSAADLAFSLRMASGPPPPGSHSSDVAPKNSYGRGLRLAAWLAMTGLIGGACGIWVSGYSSVIPHELKFMPFATDPELEAFPVFSPDGKSLAFQKGDDLYVRSLDSARATQLTSGQPIHDPPSWLPDGSRIHYASQDVCFSISSAGGAPSKVLDHCGSPEVSPDGKTLLFIRTSNNRRQWWVSSPSGTAARAMRDDLPEPAPMISSSRFSPDGSRFGFQDARGRLWIVSFPQGEMREVHGVTTASFITWFPDSRHILVNSAPDIGGGFRFTIVDTRDDARRTILQAPDVALWADLNHDGTRLAYSAGSVDWDIVEYSLDGKRLRPLAVGSRMEADPHWSPRGDEFAYVSTALGERGDLWTKSADGKRITRLVTAGDSGIIGPRFSPDGRRVAYTTADQVWIVPAEGGRGVQVYRASGRLVTAPAWSPDGEYLAVSDTSGLMKVAVGGGQPTQVLSAAGGAGGDVRWSPNGRWLCHLRRGAGIDLISSNGGEARQLTPVRGSYLNGDFTPDGKHFVFARPSEKFRWEIVTFELETGRELGSTPLALGEFDAPYFLSIHPDGRRMAVNTGRLKYDIWIVEGFPRPAAGIRRLFRHWDTSRAPEDN